MILFKTWRVYNRLKATNAFSIMPRPSSALWSHFQKDAKRAVCKYCEHNMCGLVQRMRLHLARKCPNCPAHVKHEMFEADLNRKMDLAPAAVTTTTTSNASTGALRCATCWGCMRLLSQHSLTCFLCVLCIVLYDRIKHQQLGGAERWTEWH